MPATAPITMQVLQHLYTRGASTRAQIVTELGPVPYSTLSNLRVLGNITIDKSASAATYSITPRGQKKLLGLRGAPHLRQEQVRRTELMRQAASYHGTETTQPSNRPGSMDAFALPSRIGDRLFWPDGRVTRINPTTTGERSHG
ncbi:hypothetical protein [Hydrogenophaga sp. ANAO-22]|uniref:hypothetical protein n=1 Tax=Hydrogenophaga sp. ANAO-22 TaxID=3166645 RepID=UPI0036D38E44